MNRLKDWLVSSFGGGVQARVLMLGLDSSGRTTALYQMVLGETVSTMPTIGFNVETVKHKSSEIVFWDVGGCDKIRPLWRHYFQGTDAVWFFVDSRDVDRLDDAAWSLALLAQQDELNDVPILVLANKRDAEDAETLEYIETAMQLDKVREQNGAKRTVHLMPLSGIQPGGMNDALDWTVEEMRNPSRGGSGGGGSKNSDSDKNANNDENKHDRGSDEEAAAIADEEEQHPILVRLREWLSVEDEPDDDFLEAAEQCKLQSWDHRTHVRLAWLYLTRHGRRGGMKRIFATIKNFIDNSDVARKTTFHETMTYFWAHVIHYAIVATHNPTNDFVGFLAMNPQLADGGLFLDYYSKQLMLHTKQSREQVVLPDVRPLPSIVPRKAAALANAKQGGQKKNKKNNDSSTSSSSATSPPGGMPTETEADDDIKVSLPFESMSDAVFLSLVETGRLDRWNHECQVRLIYTVLRQYGRRPGVDVAFDMLRQKVGEEAFHFTLTYFWVQVTDFARMLMDKQQMDHWKKTRKHSAVSRRRVRLPHTATFREFWKFVEEHAGKDGMPDVRDQLLFGKYYSRALIDGDESSKQFVLPDIKPLPSIM